LDVRVIQIGERPCELADMQGAWRRGGRSLSGGPSEEVADVLWLQVGNYFCDLRTPYPLTEPSHTLDQPQAFSGTITIAEGFISFHHDLDSLPRDPAHPDESTVHRKDNVMYERGPGFEEQWLASSLPGDDVAVAELRPSGFENGAPLARLVRVGSVALAVWGGAMPGGAQFTKAGGGSAERRLVGDDATLTDASLMTIDEAASCAGRDEPLPRGWIIVDPGEV
jgi:hypothetical protein